MPIDPYSPEVDKVVRFLKRNYKSPRDALKKLGLDEATTSAVMPGNEAGDRLHDLRAKLELLLENCASIDDSDMGRIVEFLETEVPFNSGSADHRARGRDQEEEPVDIEHVLGRIRKFLVEEKSMPADAVEEAVALARRDLENGAGDTMLRRSAMRGGVGGLAVHAMDSFGQMFGDVADRIGVDLTGDELASLNRLGIRQGTSLGRRPTASETNSFERMFPEASRVRVGPGR